MERRFEYQGNMWTVERASPAGAVDQDLLVEQFKNTDTGDVVPVTEKQAAAALEHLSDDDLRTALGDAINEAIRSPS